MGANSQKLIMKATVLEVANKCISEAVAFKVET